MAGAVGSERQDQGVTGRAGWQVDSGGLGRHLAEPPPVMSGGPEVTERSSGHNQVQLGPRAEHCPLIALISRGAAAGEAEEAVLHPR